MEDPKLSQFIFPFELNTINIEEEERRKKMGTIMYVDGWGFMVGYQNPLTLELVPVWPAVENRDRMQREFLADPLGEWGDPRGDEQPFRSVNFSA